MLVAALLTPFADSVVAPVAAELGLVGLVGVGVAVVGVSVVGSEVIWGGVGSWRSFDRGGAGMGWCIILCL